MTFITAASAQSVGIAPSTAPVAPDLPAGKSTVRRLQGIVSHGHDEAGAGYAYVSSRYSGDSVPPVVLKFGAADAAGIAAMEEDLTIMTHIIDRALERIGENGVDERFGVKLYYTSGGKSVRALYLDGFGPLFMVKVNFPVHSPGAVDTKPPATDSDSEWERVRRQLHGLDREVKGFGSASAGVPYDAERVEVLKKHLLGALKNASNMKGVKSDEYVNVSVFGSPATTTGEIYGRGVGAMPGAANNLPAAGRGGGAGGSVSAGRAPQPVTSIEVARTALQGTVLTLWVKKSDIDAAAKGTLDDEAFAKKVSATTYAGNGYGLTSVNSWTRSSSAPSARVRF